MKLSSIGCKEEQNICVILELSIIIIRTIPHIWEKIDVELEEEQGNDSKQAINFLVMRS